MSQDNLQAPPAPKIKVRGTILAACIAVLIAQLANALPGALNGTFQLHFQASGSQIAWISAAFMLPVVVFELTFGMLGDKFGQRKLTIIGAATLLIGSLICALAPTVQVLWLGSAINGLGAGAVYPASLSLIASVTQTATQRARGIATWAGCLSAGAVVAPLMGGLFASMGFWQLAYYGLGVLAVISIVLCTAVSIESQKQPSRRMDPWGQATFAAGLLLLLFALVQGPEMGWGHGVVIGSLVIGAALLVIFLRLQRKVSEPLLRLDLFKNRSFTVSSVIAVAGMFAFLGICYSFSMWLGPVQHQNPLNIGLLFLLLQGPAFILIPLVSTLMTRVSERWILTAGLLLMSAGGFLGFQFDVAARGMGQFLLPALLTGLGFAFSLSTVTSVAINSVPPTQAGMASATTNLLRDLGFALGPVVIVAVAMSAASQKLAVALSSSALPPGQLEPARSIFEAGGPLALNSVAIDAPGGQAAALALESLGTGFNAGFLVCAISALAMAVLAALLLPSRRTTIAS